MDFHEFAVRVHARYMELRKSELFVVGTTEGIFEHYLASFPEGSNPIYKVRTEHDCSCCKNFVRNLGRVVSLANGTMRTVWDVAGLESPFKEVAASMDEYVRAQPIQSVFRTKERSYGNEFTRQLLEDGSVKRWNHFHGTVGELHHHTSPDQARGEFNTSVHVFRRGLEELKPEAVQTVLDLIKDKSIYRGEEHLPAVKAFRELQKHYSALDARARDIYVWLYAQSTGSRFRNTVIGTLVQDLSAGIDIEEAVKSFESKVAPANYKRTTALITPRMVQDAMKTVNELGLEPALHRRLARLADVSVSNVLWVDRSARALMKGGVADVLMAAATTAAPAAGKATDISIDKFMSEVLPTAQGMELHLRNTHLTNFVTLTAPVHPDTGRLFKWGNDFAWSYDGNITDSIREKVKAAGGNVNAKLRFSLAWYNYDDLDIHVREPDGTHIYFGNKCGKLDVDMNAYGPRSRQPVENVSFTRPADGKYRVYVNQYNRRETTDFGFSVEIASASGTTQVSYPKGINSGLNIDVGTFTVKNGAIVESQYGPSIIGSGIPQTKWGLKTESNVKVQTVMFSPNYWDDNAVGNKHWFFILEGCRVEEPMRGIYNEFLASGLEKHRKVFEVLGDNTKCPPTDEQLSGLGFSSTRGDSVTVSVKSDRGARLFNIQF